MRINTYGNFENKKLFLIHPLFCDEQVFEKLIPALIKDYYVVSAIISGHYPNSTFRSILEEELEMSIYLKSHNINKIDVMIGVGDGGNIAFDFFYKNTDIIDKLIIDSAPLTKMPFILKKYYIIKYRNIMINIIKKKNNSDNLLKKEFKCLAKYVGRIMPLVTEKTIKNAINSIYNIKFYNFNKKKQEKITFVYSDKDKKVNLKRLKKYKYSEVITVFNAERCQYIIEKPKSYINKIINKNL